MNASGLMTSSGAVKPAVYLHYLVMVMMCAYLLADMMSGFTQIYMGLDLKISLIYKTPLFALLLLLIARYHLGWAVGLLVTLMLLLIGPTAAFYRHVNIGLFFADFGYVVKLLMPITVVLYFGQLYRFAPDFAFRWGKRILWSAFAILCFNFVLASIGIGKGTYQLEDDETAGSTGLIYAGNELGAAFLVVFGYALHQIWNSGRFYVYLLASAITLGCGLLVATKTTMLAAVLLVTFIPIVNERQHLFRLTWLKIKILSPFVLAVVALVILIADLLEAIGLYDRIVWFYEQRGLIGILWSGRDQFLSQMIHIYLAQSSLFEQIFGQGIFVGELHPFGKASAEVDTVDALMWFGFLGLTVCLAFYSWSFVKSLSRLTVSGSSFGPYLALSNGLLILLSQLSGHIWFSGTLGIVFGVMNSLIWFEFSRNVEKSK
ncbi:O-antigen ligase family protein [Shewanella sp. FJAT-52076]|uniref:O-antigen ligase family protein n=1 Tax=Shewanella sp. FJAT-52076 TaxID=2864202 RepID=UPI001C65A805|nr:O-antigen ligase family protein [Shewanella sp. FJAT-52076]QYJ74039.1 O-antigen ligase family protein [Shewanella sp. FJAT-52076]